MIALVLAAVIAAAPCAGDGHNQHRSAAAKRSFRRAHPCPATHRKTGACPGYVIDHICPLACCGLDAPQNMQWQTKAAAKEKDRWELDCPRSCAAGAQP